MSEAKYQSKVIKKLEADGFYVIKIIRASPNGIPDLIALKPNEVRFIEVKGTKTPVSKLQEYRIKELTKFGFNATIDREPT